MSESCLARTALRAVTTRATRYARSSRFSACAQRSCGSADAVCACPSWASVATAGADCAAGARTAIAPCGTNGRTPCCTRAAGDAGAAGLAVFGIGAVDAIDTWKGAARASRGRDAFVDVCAGAP